MHFCLTEDEFWTNSPAASEIFAYREQLRISSGFGFVRGSVSVDRTHTHAEFSCVSVSGLGRDHLYVSATRRDDGGWDISHQIKQEEAR